MYHKKIKTTSISLILSLFIQILTVPVSYAAEPCLIPNPESAGTVSNWSAFLYTNCKGYATLDDDVKYSGTSSLKITNPTPYGANLYMQVRTVTKTLEKGKTYRYGAMVKAKYASNVTLGILNEVKNTLVPITNTYDWKKFEITYTPGESKTIEICFQCEDATSGLWIDDVFCYEYKDGKYVGENLIKNPNFDGTAVNVPEAPADTDGEEDEEVLNASDQIALMQEKYEKVKSSEEFPAEDVKEIMGNFKYIPLYYKEDILIDGDVSDWDNAVTVALPTNAEQYHIYKQGCQSSVCWYKAQMGYSRKCKLQSYKYL